MLRFQPGGISTNLECWHYHGEKKYHDIEANHTIVYILFNA